jgi:hypothetical protein
MMFVYKIRRKSDGLFSTGGMSPNWSKTGKTWNAIGHLKNHLHQFDHIYDYNRETGQSFYRDETPNIYGGCEIITYELDTRIVEAERKDVC